MKSCSPQLVAFLNSAQSCITFDLWTITLQSGLVLRWTDADIDIKDSGNTFVRGPVLTRSRVTQSRGIEVGSLRATMDGPAQLIGSQVLPAFAASGGFEGAAVQIDVVYFDLDVVLQGVLYKHFVGSVSDVTPKRMGAKLTVKQATSKLSQQTPTDTYQAACANNFCDAKCGLSEAAYTVSGTVTAIDAGSNPTITVSFTSSVTAAYFELGIASVTSGANFGIARTVQAQIGWGTTAMLRFARPFPQELSVGDAVSVSAGCNKTVVTCKTKFNNLPRCRSTPFIPVVETGAAGG